MDDNPYVHSDRTQHRLRVRLARAHLKAADRGAFDAAIATLLRVAMGVDRDGKPIDVSPRTQAVAAAALLRAGLDLAKDPSFAVVHVEGGTVQVNIGPRDDAERRAYLQRVLDTMANAQLGPGKSQAAPEADVSDP